MALEKNLQEALPEGLKAELMPKHVAMVLDGNRRWAKEKGLMVVQGHTEAKRVILELVSLSRKWGIQVLSIFCFSTENWSRPQEEVEFLMRLFEDVVVTYLDDFCRQNARLTFIGDRSKLPELLLSLINSAEEKTRSNEGIHLLIGLNYSGRYDIMQATRSISSKVRDGMLNLEDIDEGVMEQELQTSCTKYPAPDLLIRTSGEQRISNFMLWQLAYTELYFPKKKFPDFEEQDYVEALLSFQQRDRRFGGKKYA